MDATTPRRARVLALLLAAAVVVAACGTDGQTDGAATTTTVPLADQPAYEEPGPYVVGTTTLDLGGRVVEVWYPADPGAEAGAAKDVFEIRDLLPEALKSLVPDELNPRYETAAYLDIPASDDGPFPLVIFAHGFGAYPTEYQFLLTHLASWGFVVAGPDFTERSLLAAFTGAVSTTTTTDDEAARRLAQQRLADEAAIMTGTRELLAAENAEPGGLLEGRIDTTRVGVAGHSAGVASAVAAADTDPAVKTFVAMSGGRPPGGGFELPAPAKPGMVMTGGRDQVASLDRVEGFYRSLEPPKRLVVIDEAGHNSFTDLCVIGADQGGLVEIARKVGIPVPEQLERLFNDGCVGEFLPPTDAWPPILHFVTAQFRYELGVDAEPVGLGPGVATAFPPAKVTYEESL
jgi:dienelactone hydrolase